MLKLRIKYGLAPYEPTEKQAKEWKQRTLELVSQKYSPEDAGDSAAKQIFATYQKYKWAAQPDTINDILDEIKD